MTKMSAKRHLKELQWRFMLIALFFVVGAALAFHYRDILMPILLNPLNGQKLVYLTPGGGFTFTFLVAAYAGIALAFPVFLHQLYLFLKPTLPEKAQKKSVVILISSVVLLSAGIVFGYLVAVPSALTFLYGFADSYVEAALTADSYINFVVAYTIGIGLVFQLPLLMLLLHAIKPQKPGGLMKSQKWVILGAFIVAAIITPTPDPVNQAIIAGPIVVVYQIGVIAVLITIARTARQLKVQERKARRAQKALDELALPEPAANTAPALPLATLKETEMPQLSHGARVLAREAVTLTPTEPLTDSLEIIAEEPAPTIEPSIIDEPIKHTAPTAHAARQSKVIDGFVRRPNGPLHVPQRPAQQVRPQSRPIPPAPQSGPARGFYVDGIIAPRTA